MLRVAIVGAGQIAQEHLRVWKTLPNTSVQAVCDVNMNSARSLALAAGPSATPYSDFSALLLATSFDLVDICTPPSTHADLAIRAMESGRDVLVEKPMAASVEEAREMIRVHRATGARLGIMRNWLFGPVLWKALTMVHRGDVGEVLSVQINMLDTPQDDMIADPRHWSHSLSGGRLGECLIHPLYIAQAFLGNIELREVLPDKRGSYSWVAIDEVQITVKGERGIGNLYVSFNAPRKSVAVEVIGTKAILRVDMINHSLVKLGKSTDDRRSRMLTNLGEAAQLIKGTIASTALFATGRWQSGGHTKFLEIFAESIESGRPFPVTAEEALRSFEILNDVGAILDSYAPAAVSVVEEEEARTRRSSKAPRTSSSARMPDAQ